MILEISDIIDIILNNTEGRVENIKPFVETDNSFLFYSNYKIDENNYSIIIKVSITYIDAQTNINSILNNNFISEYITDLMSKIDKGPKVYKIINVQNAEYIMQIILMERYDCNAHSFIIKNPEYKYSITIKILNEFKNLIFIHNIYITDFKFFNIVLNKNDYINIKFIDFESDLCSIGMPKDYFYTKLNDILNENTKKKIFYTLCILQFMFLSFYNKNKYEKDPIIIDIIFNDPILIEVFELLKEEKFKEILESMYEKNYTHGYCLKHYFDLIKNEENEEPIRFFYKLYDDKKNKNKELIIDLTEEF